MLCSQASTSQPKDACSASSTAIDRSALRRHCRPRLPPGKRRRRRPRLAHAALDDELHPAAPFSPGPQGNPARRARSISRSGVRKANTDAPSRTAASARYAAASEGCRTGAFAQRPAATCRSGLRNNRIMERAIDARNARNGAARDIGHLARIVPARSAVLGAFGRGMPGADLPGHSAIDARG